LLEENWKVYGLSRRAQSYLPDDLLHITVDLTDAANCKARLEALEDVSHVFITTWVKTGSDAGDCKVLSSSSFLLWYRRTGENRVCGVELVEEEENR
jgi:hypothetical protein